MTESLYRKYRPQTFADVVGQDAIERTLRNALAQNKVSHAYLFTGPRGTGKTTTARLMAKALLCAQGVTPDPDGTCDSCEMIAEGTHPDVYELDAASRTGVDNVREEIIGRVNFAPTVGRAKVYIIDEVHMLSTAAFNALLKTLEEPPDHVVFILCTTDPQKVPATIHSRCQRFDFHRISADEIVARLGAVCVSEEVDFEPEALALIADRSDGGMRNALTTLEQLIVFCDGHVTLSGAEDLLGSLASSDMAEIVRAVGERDAAKCFLWTAKYVETGADLAQFVEDFAARVRTLYVLSVAGDDAPLELGESERAQMATELRLFGPDRLARLMTIVGDLMNELRGSRNPRLAFEIALTRMVRPGSDMTVDALAERVETLERKLEELEAARAALPVGMADSPAGGVQASGMAGTGISAGMTTSGVAAGAPMDGVAAGIPADVSASERAAASTPMAGATAPGMGMPPARMPEGGAGSAGSTGGGSAASAAGVPGAAPAAGAAGGVSQPGSPAIGQAAPSGELARALGNPATLQRLWKASIDQLKKVKTAYGVLFMNTMVRVAPTGDAIVVSFPATNTFAYGAVRKPEVYDELQKAVSQAFGEPVTVQFVQEGAGGAPSAPPLAQGPAAAPASQVAPQAAHPAPAPQPAHPAPQPQAHPAPQPARPAPAPASDGGVQASPASSQVAQAVSRQAASSATASQGAAVASPAGTAPGTQSAAARIPSDERAFDEVPVDMYDEVPVDAYGDYDDTPYTEAPAPFAPASNPVPQPGAPKSPARNVASAAASEPAPFIPPTAPVEAVGTSVAPGDTAGEEDIAGILASTFGDAVTFEEVEGE